MHLLQMIFYENRRYLTKDILEQIGCAFAEYLIVSSNRYKLSSNTNHQETN